MMHSLIDYLCAFSLFHTYLHRPKPFSAFLTYTFCAFALQLPAGIMLDYAVTRKSCRKAPLFTILLGCAVTAAGVFFGPVMLGIGNALFHTGGGVLSIQEDRRADLSGAGLGVFVAPGAIGLFLGSVLSYNSLSVTVTIVSALLAVCGILLYREEADRKTHVIGKPAVFDCSSLCMLGVCFAVVILRSAVGFAETFAWKTGFFPAFAAVCMTAAGKAAGGLFSAAYGTGRTIIVSLALSAVCFVFKDVMPAGLAALFFFNMTMPLTLYLLAETFFDMPGFSFGTLTFGLFIGYAAVRVYGLSVPYAGVIGSLASLVLLVIGEKIRNG